MTPLHPRRTRKLIGLALLLGAGPAAADQFDTFNITLGASAMHDSNLFRLPSSASPTALLGTSQKSDTIGISTLGLKIAKNYSLQRFELEASLVDYKYRTFDYLDFTATNYAAAWRWALTPHFHGNLSRTQTEALNNFSDYTGYRRQNIRTTQVSRFDGDYELGAVHLIAGVTETRSENSSLFVAEGNNTLDTAEAGLRYVFRSGASLSAINRQGHGDYYDRPNPIPVGLLDNRFDQTENELRLSWPITGKTNLDGRVSHLERKQDHYSARDYSGTVGILNLNWQITGKTSLNASAGRTLSAYQTLYSSYTSTDRVTLAPFWQISAKTGLRASYNYSRVDFNGAIATTTLNDRRDTIRLGAIALEWQAATNFLVSTSLTSDRRSSNKQGYDYEATIGQVSAQISF